MARPATSTVELNVKVMIAAIFQRTRPHARRITRRALRRLEGHTVTLH
jgi:hypothetical protein